MWADTRVSAHIECSLNGHVVAVCCSMLQCVAVCCSELQCAAEGSVLRNTLCGRTHE